MTRLLTAAALLGLCAGMLGCQPTQKYAELDAAYRTQLARNQELEQQLDALRKEIDLLQGRIGESDALSGAAGETNAALRAQLARLKDEYRRLEERLNSMGVMLNPETDAALRQLASEFPGVIEYDAQRGMLRFASDLTFALGSVEVKPEARASLEKLAKVMSAPTALGYDLRIVGHTDDVRISAATARNHPTNTHLSAHRAIAVRDVLGTSGINSARMEIAGWGEFRPAIPNRPGRQGTIENRRVEIFLLPASSGSASSGSGGAGSAPASTPRPAPKPTAAEPMK